MKKFIFNIIVTLLLAAAPLLALSWWNATAIHRVSWKLNPNTHIIAIGPSTTGCALNEKHIKGFKNMSRSDTGIQFLVPLLPRLLDENPIIDTVLISHGRFNFSPFGGGAAPKEFQKVRDKLPLFFYDINQINWDPIVSNPNFYGVMLNPDILQTILNIPHNLVDFRFGHNSIARNDLYLDSAYCGIANYNKVRSNYSEDFYTKKWILENRGFNDIWSKRAIEICKERGVVPILIFTPLYQFSRWCDIKGFCELMKDYPEDTLIADYEDFVFPDERYYGDVIHLNPLGADYFTSYLAKNGIKVQKLHEWLREKGY